MQSGLLVRRCKVCRHVARQGGGAFHGAQIQGQISVVYCWASSCKKFSQVYQRRMLQAKKGQMFAGDVA
ncbi:hypothetical protein BLL52_2526 [Rhodoferax antarcticus ANT.BR]|uniref:Uncharacterized protein n=1 Tax=Rhodoferax antarcticus ANT.BR TaxID=1111071 RepID=A0A1Q8YEA4_9BURK|nr:hypothetical protein BLL52_2526 [Rhodoferax antarcticus ANT.BR]